MWDEGPIDKMFRKLLAAVFLSIFLLGFVYVTNILDKPADLISPGILGSRIANNLWFPQAEVNSSLEVPEITARAAYFVDIDSGKVLFEKDAREKLPVASLTKIMTAIVTLENRSWGDEVMISEGASGMEPDRMDLRAGEKLTVEELMSGMFLVSGNDAAEALAENTAGGRENFIAQMNAKALQLGMKETLFINPTGLEEEGRQQYSSAYEVALMSRYAVKNFPHLVDISRNPHIFIPATQTHQDYDLYSGINLLTTYPGVIGLKTGFTPEAGLTLVTLAEKGGHKVLGVLLRSENRRAEARQLLDYSFSQLGI